jgi:hypothetical protein
MRAQLNTGKGEAKSGRGLRAGKPGNPCVTPASKNGILEAIRQMAEQWTQAQMSKITVNVDADGQPESFTFDWTGTLQDWKGLVDAVAILAQRKGCDPEQFVKSVLREFPSTGPIPITEPDGANQRLAILFAVLASMNAHADELPGPVLNCLDRYDITATVTIRDGDISMETEGLPWTLH